MSGSVLLHRQRSVEDLQQLLAWYKIRGTLLGQTVLNIKRALELASISEHPDAVWLTEVFGGRDVATAEEARQVFLGCESDPRALCFAGLFGDLVDEVRRAAILGDAVAKRGWRGELKMESLFDGRKNLLLKENAMVSSGLDRAMQMQLDAKRTWKEQKRTFFCC
jgi:hypothetical protein